MPEPAIFMVDNNSDLKSEQDIKVTIYAGLTSIIKAVTVAEVQSAVNRLIEINPKNAEYYRQQAAKRIKEIPPQAEAKVAKPVNLTAGQKQSCLTKVRCRIKIFFEFGKQNWKFFVVLIFAIIFACKLLQVLDDILHALPDKPVKYTIIP